MIKNMGPNDPKKIIVIIVRIVNASTWIVYAAYMVGKSIELTCTLLVIFRFFPELSTRTLLNLKLVLIVNNTGLLLLLNFIWNTAHQFDKWLKDNLENYLNWLEYKFQNYLKSLDDDRDHWLYDNHHHWLDDDGYDWLTIVLMIGCMIIVVILLFT